MDVDCIESKVWLVIVIDLYLGESSIIVIVFGIVFI